MDIYLGLRDRENAIKWLEKAYEERSYYLCYINVLPAFDLLRSDPRFQEVLRRVGIAGR